MKLIRCVAICVGMGLLAASGARADLAMAESPPSLPVPQAAWITGSALLAQVESLSAPQTRFSGIAAIREQALDDGDEGGRQRDVEATLWAFIRALRAQREQRPFEILEARVALLQATTSAPSQVPLPPSLWLLLMGLLGFAGSRLLSRDGAVGAGREAMAAAAA